ncbi:acyltransferase [Enterobacter mori]|uniref:acyltransferase n=1 Tax=Enterobacter mori TaxID=539813 RepID=UPI001BE04DB9|nr:acyltransferase [Enterobacter mori]MBT1869487.1 acyltransferase [Enterobacter mori]
MSKIVKGFMYTYVGIWNHLLCYIPSYNLRWMVLKYLYRAKIERGVNIHMGVKFFSPWKLKVKKGTNIQWGSFLDCRGGLEIGANVDITLGVKILTQYHNIHDENYCTVSKLVRINDDSIVGSYSLLLPGSQIEKFGVLGAGSVLTKIVSENTLFAGNPATFIKKRDITRIVSVSYKRTFH